jgi:hypothetical protein
LWYNLLSTSGELSGRAEECLIKGLWKCSIYQLFIVEKVSYNVLEISMTENGEAVFFFYPAYNSQIKIKPKNPLQRSTGNADIRISTLKNLETKIDTPNSRHLSINSPKIRQEANSIPG